ncbi:MAG TPA: signal peptidase I [Thermoleophilaceae bacterium]|nr:signal peptidase I [Thermoleophilaceae bacterium]
MIVALVLAAAVPVIFGGRSFSVMSGSMEPSISTGDLVVTLPIAPHEARGGDVVTFTDPENNDRLLTHRVASSADRGDNYALVTKGDANNTVERWTVPADGRIGRVIFRVPELGYLLTFARGPAARVLLIAIPALMLAGFALLSIWRPRRKEAPDVPAAA